MKPKKNNALASIIVSRDYLVRQPISLWDMIQASTPTVLFAIRNLDFFSNTFSDLPPGDDVEGENKRTVANILSETKRHFAELEFSKAGFAFERLERLIARGSSEKCTNHILVRELKGLRDAICDDLRTRTFLFVPENKLQFLDQDKAFGKAVHANFPSARRDVKDAANCIVFDLHTAAVFHLMRVAEFGIRALANDLKVKIRNIPLEYAEWNRIISEITAKVNAIQQKPGRSRKKMEAVEFYRGLLGEIHAFKDVWRNSVMHTRASYNEQEAIGVYVRIKDFMQRLANRIAEV